MRCHWEGGKREKRIGAKGIKKGGKKEEEDMVVGVGSLCREWQCTVPLWFRVFWFSSACFCGGSLPPRAGNQ